MHQIDEQTFIRDLGDGLILRRSIPADADKLADFNARMHSENGWDSPDDRLSEWTRDLLTKPHPTFGSGDFTIVEEQATGRIVSSLNHISQTWTYDGIPFKVGRPELVGTIPEYRHKRLVGAQFDEIHHWSAARGEVVQAITGIPHYYKRFDYEMGLELGGGRVGFAPLIPKLKDGESEPFVVRRAEERDIPFLMEVDAFAGKRQLIRAVRDESIWRYELNGKSERNVNREVFSIIQTSVGEPVGFLSHPWFNWTLGVALMEYELKPGVSWLAVTPSVARYLLSTSKEHAARDNEPLEQKIGVVFWHGTSHPVYEVWREKLPRIRKAYAWYVRVPDLAGFLRLIAPVLDKRLAESYLPGYSGMVRLGFYRDGLLLIFDGGRLKEVAPFKPEPNSMGDVVFPNLTFLQLLFGFRSLAELEDAYMDCYCENDEFRLVVSTLFPKKPSSVAGLV